MGHFDFNGVGTHVSLSSSSDSGAKGTEHLSMTLNLLDKLPSFELHIECYSTPESQFEPANLDVVPINPSELKFQTQIQVSPKVFEALRNIAVGESNLNPKNVTMGFEGKIENPFVKISNYSTDALHENSNVKIGNIGTIEAYRIIFSK